MSVLRKAFRQGAWLSAFKLFGQSISWATTILVARILVPGDYGLMAIATVFSGYAMLFSELGLGASIIQRHENTENELYSVFWFGFAFSIFLGISCFPLAYITSHVFDNQRVIPIVQMVSILFIMNGLQIVPLNLLRKNLLFKKTGLIEISGTIVSCLSMIAMAHMGAGVWTLIGGHIFRSITKLIFIYWIAKWYPKFHFKFEELKPYLKFGLKVASTNSVFYVNEKSDSFFAGMVWPTLILGYYSLALQLARMPIDKLIGLITQISFPLFSKLQGDRQQLNFVYLKILKLITTIIFPIYVGGFLIGDDLIKVILGEKWLEMSFVFRWLCLSQIMVTLSSVNGQIHLANGRPLWNLYYNVLQAGFMGISFYFAVGHGLNWIILPWMLTSNFLSAFWILVTIKKIKIPLFAYIQNLVPQLIATFFMAVLIFLFDNIALFLINIKIIPVLKLSFLISLGSLSYLTILFLIDNTLLNDLKKLKKREVLITA